MFIFKLAILNIFRNKVQSLISLLAICSAISILLFFRGFIDFSLEGLKSSTIRTELGHFQVAKSSHFEIGGDIVSAPENQIEKSIYEKIYQRFSQQSNIVTISPRLSTSGLVAYNDKSLYAKITGIDSKRDEEFSSYEFIVEGRQIKREGECVVGNALSKALSLNINNEITIMSTTEYGGINALTCNLVGIVKTQSKELDKVYVKMDLNSLQSLIDTQRIDYMMFLMNDDYIAQDGLEEIKKIISDTGLKVKTWEELAEYYQSVKSLYESVFNIALFSLLVIMILSILNTVSMSIFERMSEIGMLRAVGMSRYEIFKLFLFEGFLLGLFGGVFSCIVSYLIISLINYLGGIPMPPPPGMTSGYNVYINISFGSILLSLLLSLFSSMAATIYPAFITSRKEIISAINSQ